MNKQRVYNLMILDESGSMGSIHQATVSGFNEMVETMQEAQRSFPEQEHFVSLITFNGSGIRTKLDRDPVSDIRKLKLGDYRPASSTPLYDAIGQGLSRLAYKIEKTGVEANVLVTILTDGEENSSREYSGRQIKDLIDQMTARGWVFTFIGSNIDVEKVAESMSVKNFLSFDHNPKKMNEMFIKERSSRMSSYDKLSKMDPNWGQDYFKDKPGVGNEEAKL